MHLCQIASKASCSVTYTEYDSVHDSEGSDAGMLGHRAVSNSRTPRGCIALIHPLLHLSSFMAMLWGGKQRAYPSEVAPLGWAHAEASSRCASSSWWLACLLVVIATGIAKQLCDPAQTREQRLAEARDLLGGKTMNRPSATCR